MSCLTIACKNKVGVYFSGAYPNVFIWLYLFMPRATYGAKVRHRVADFLDSLLSYVNGELDVVGCDLRFRWQDEGTSTPQLCIETTLKNLVLLGKTKSPEDTLTKAQVREALKRLEDYLGILVDHRASLQGAEDWNFTLKLWSRDKAENLKILESQWEERRIRNLKITQPKLKEEPLNQPSLPQRGIPFSAPPLPRCHVARPEHLNAVRELLLSEATPNTLVVSAISGMGGIGKSVLAAELVREKAVVERFQDGVLWATLGQEPDLLSIVTQWIQELGDYDYKPTTQDAASRHLGALLMDKQILLVIDDVWDPDHVKPFEILGLGCRLLVTTRQAQIMGALRYDLDVMTKSQSLELLRGYLGELLIPENLEIAEAFAQEVGYLPLALALAAALIEDGLTWNELLADFKVEVARLETLALDEYGALGDESVKKKRSLLASFYLTLKQLSAEQLKQFAWLGVVPEDVSITQEMSATLWEVTVRQGGAILRALKNRALLLPQARKPDQPMTYRIHDLVHHLAKNLLTNRDFLGNLSGLGLSLEDAHSKLIERYRSYTQDGLWSTLNDDGYIYSHLTWHFEKAKQPELIHQLFRETTPEGRNGWYEACDRLGQPAIFVTDLIRAWRLAKDMYREDASRSIGLQVRYALIFSSLNSLASNIPAELIAAFVEKKKWSPAKGLAYAQQTQRLDQRAEIIQALSVYLSPVLLSEALEVARKIQNEHQRANAFIGLALHLPEVMSEALEVACAIQAEYDRANALNRLAPHLPEKLLSKALEVARGIQDEYDRVRALIGIAPRLPGVIPEALEVARGIRDEYHRPRALNLLVPYLPEVIPEALEVAREIRDEFNRASALIEVAPHLQENLLSEALEAVREIQNEYHRSWALSKLAPHLPKKLLSVALEVARKIRDEFSQADAIIGLTPHLPKKLLSEALEMARRLQNEYDRARALIGLVPYLPEIILEALEVARQIRDEYDQVRALIGLAPRLPEKLLSEVLEVTRGIQDEYHRSWALSKLAPHLPEKLLSVALEVARGIRDEYNRVNILIELAPNLPELIPKALEVAREIKFDYHRANALSLLGSHLPEIIPEALEVMRGIRNEYDQVRALIGLAPYLPEIMFEALEMAREIRDEYNRANALIEVAPHLRKNFLSEALEVARGIQHESFRADALIGLAPHLPEMLLPEALEMARGTQNEYDRVRALIELAPHLPEMLLPEALEVAQGIQDKEHRAYALSLLVPHLPEVIPEVLELVRGIQDNFHRADALSLLVPYLPEIIPEVLEVMREIQFEGDRADALSRLVTCLPENFLSRALEVARGIQDEAFRANAFSSIASQLNSKNFNLSFWSEVLHVLSYRGRKDLLGDLSGLALAAIKLSDRSVLKSMVQAIREICQQWP
jgi:hypothetical protein